MKKITFLLVLLVCSFQAIAQVLNQPAAWPNTDWTVTGTFVAGPTIVEADPTLTANFAYDDDDAGAAAVNNIAAESPVIDLTAAFNAGETWLFLNSTYVYNHIGDDSITIQYWNADTSAWVDWGTPLAADTPAPPLDNFCAGTTAAYESAELNIAGFTATQLSGFRYRIRYDDGGVWAWGFCFNAPTITSEAPPPCSIVTGLTVGIVTSTTAELSWNPGTDETAWQVVVQAPGTGIPSGDGDPATSNSPYLAMSLDPATSYEAYVRADCGVDGFSDWVGPVNFTTECVTFVAPYSEGFENAGTIPNCWTMNGGEIWRFSDTGAGNHIGNNGTITGTTTTNGYFAWVDSSGAEAPAVLLSPLVDVSGLTNPALTFFEISNNEGNANSTLTVEVFDGAAWNLMGTFNTNTAGWELKVINLSGLTITGDVQARFTFSETVSGDFYDDIAIDDVTFDELPSCPAPSMLVVGSITSNGAEFSWSENGSATSWNVEIVTAGTAPTGVPTEMGVTNPYTVSTLTAVTDYDFYVQADCGGETSTWVGPVTFTTLCDIFVPDYLAQFNTFIQDCWDEADSGDPTTGPGNLGAGSWGADGFANNGFTGANSINLWLAEKSDWMLSPLFDLTGGPFQVELDLAIMQFASSTNAGTLGSDDQVQLLITNDNGATWINLNTWNNTTPVAAGGEHYVYDLTPYGGQIVQFAVWASEGTVDDSADNDVSFDNFRIRNIPTCLEPTALMSTNLSLTSTEVSWTANGGETVWNIEYGPAGFTPGTGTMVTGVTTNPYVLDNLTSDTDYDFYVQADCGAPDGLSSFAGPGSFFTGYCASVPSSNDGQGVTNTTIGVTDFPSFGDVTYENHTATVVNAFQGVETNVIISFATGFTYDVNIWIDFNDNLVFEASEIVFQGETTNANPTIFDASFTMPVDAALGEHRMRIGTADFGQDPPDPCFDGSFGVTLDFTVNIIVLDCVLPEANFTATADCDGNQFFIDVEVTNLGDATSLEISNDFDATTVQALAVDTYQIGPFAFGTTVRVFVTNEQNNNCVISSPNLVLLGCPPVNDNCDGAIVAVVNPGESCTNVTPGTILAASPSGVPAGSCTGNPNDDVWFQFTALGAQQIIQLQNFAGGTEDLDHAVYEGVCGSLVELYCSPDDNSVTPNLTIGNTYYVRVFSAGAVEETTTFDLCIQTLGNPTYCLDALPICASDLQYPSVVGDEEAPPYLDYDCLFSQPDPTWNSVYFDTPGDYTFTLAQTGDDGFGNDIDFIIWGPFDSQQGACFDLIPSTIADCSYSAVSVETITLNNVQAGDVFILLITNFSQQPGFYTFTQASGPADGTNCEIVCDVTIDYQDTPVLEDVDNPGFGVPIELCGFNSITLTANSPYADFYEWYLDGFAFSNDETVTVTESGLYQVLVNGDVCDGNSLSIQVPVIFGQEPTANAVGDLVTCDDASGDGVEAFDLESQTAAILGGQDATMFNVTYHLSQNDANTGTGALTSPYTNISNPQTIYVRVEDADATFCIATTSFNLVISGPTPTVTSVDYSLCDDGSNDGFASFDLTTQDLLVLGAQNPADFNVTYYLSEADANAGTGELGSPYTNVTNPQTIWVRVESNVSASCYGVGTITLSVTPAPTAGAVPDLGGCDADGDGTPDFDLTTNEADILQGQTGMTVSYHTSQDDADNNVGAIGTPSNYSSVIPATIFVRVQSGPDCYSTTSFNLIDGVNPITTIISDTGEFDVCDTATVPLVLTAVPGNYTESEVSIVWYQDGGEIPNETGLNLDVLTGGLFEVEVTFNATGCTDRVGQQVTLVENCIIPQGISPNGDGLNDTFDLSNFNVKRIEIFNRLGTLVYSKENYIDEWHGQSDNGDELPVGTYFYTMSYEGGTKTKSAWVYINK